MRATNCGTLVGFWYEESLGQINLSDVRWKYTGSNNVYELWVQANNYSNIAPFVRCTGNGYTSFNEDTGSNTAPSGSTAFSTYNRKVVGTTATIRYNPTDTTFSRNIKMDSGYGIDFSATSDASITGASMSSELLDDYEEGSWTPYFIVNGGTSGVTQPSSMQGKYTKIGNRVFVNCWGNGTLVYSGSTGHSVNMKGLPFNAIAGNFFSTFSHWLYRFATNAGDVNKHIIFRTNNGTDQIEVQKNTGNGCTYADFNGVSGNWIIAAHYVAA